MFKIGEVFSSSHEQTVDLVAATSLKLPALSSVFVVMLAKERHGEHKKVDWKTYIFK